MHRVEDLLTLDVDLHGQILRARRKRGPQLAHIHRVVHLHPSDHRILRRILDDVRRGGQIHDVYAPFGQYPGHAGDDADPVRPDDGDDDLALRGRSGNECRRSGPQRMRHAERLAGLSQTSIQLRDVRLLGGLKQQDHRELIPEDRLIRLLNVTCIFIECICDARDDPWPVLADHSQYESFVRHIVCSFESVHPFQLHA